MERAILGEIPAEDKMVNNHEPNMASLVVRDAVAADAAAVAAIYNHAVRETTAIWNDREVDAADRVAWIAERQGAGFAVLVAEFAGAVAGYSTYGPFRPHDGYRHTVENSVYIMSRFQGKGVGRTLMMALIERASHNGFHVMVAGVEAGNEASMRLHRALGFREAGRLPQVGMKFGRWLDLAFMTRALDARETP